VRDVRGGSPVVVPTEPAVVAMGNVHTSRGGEAVGRQAGRPAAAHR